MNLEEMSKLVAFMKENGVAQLSYSSKGTSVSLSLMPPRPPKGGRPGPMFLGKKEESSFAPESSEIEVEFSTASEGADEMEPDALDSKALKAMAKEARRAAKAAAKEAKAAAKEAARAAKEALKRYQEAAAAEGDETKEAPAEVAQDAAELDTAEAELDAEAETLEIDLEPAEAEPGRTISIDTDELKETAMQAAARVGDAATAAAKIGVQLGMQGLQYLKDKRDELVRKAEDASDAPKAEPPAKETTPEDSIELTLEPQDKKDE